MFNITYSEIKLIFCIKLIFISQLFHTIQLFYTIRLNDNVAHKSPRVETNLLVAVVCQLDHHPSCIFLVNIPSRFKAQWQRLMWSEEHAQLYTFFPLDYTSCIHHSSFTGKNNAVTLCLKFDSMINQRLQMIWYCFGKEVFQIMILLHFLHHTISHVVTSVSVFKLKQNQRNASIYTFSTMGYCIMLKGCQKFLPRYGIASCLKVAQIFFHDRVLHHA